jgi:hypothetical protein
MPVKMELIETAPKNGTKFIGWNGFTYEITSWDKKWEWWSFPVGNEKGTWFPTHWAPLPEHPSPT